MDTRLGGGGWLQSSIVVPVTDVSWSIEKHRKASNRRAAFSGKGVSRNVPLHRLLIGSVTRLLIGSVARFVLSIWKTPRDEPTCWATPLVIPDSGASDSVASDSGGAQVVMNGQTKARAYDLETGKELWSCGGQTQRPVATPVYRDGIVYVGSGFRGSFLAALKTDGRGNVEGTDAVVWSVDRDTPDIASLLLSENRLYFFKAKTGLLSCLNAIDGRAYYKTVRLPNISTTYASPVAAGGHVYLTGRSGTTVVIDDAETFNVVSINSVGEGVDATPAVVDNEIFIRGAKHLFCIAQQ